MVPFKYTVRNLRVRWVTTLLTVLATGLVVWSSCLLFGLVEGLEFSLRISGDPLDLIVLRKGSTSETNSGFETAKADELRTLGHVARDPKSGQPLVAAELLNIPVMERADGTRANLTIRGVEPASRALRPDFRIVEGRDINTGVGECIVPKQLSGRFKGTRVGETLKAGEKESYRVVGIFTAGGSAAESEIWVDRKDLEAHTARAGSVSCVQVRAASTSDIDRLMASINNETRFKLEALRENDYFSKQTAASGFLKVSGTIISFLLSIGAMFAVANTMYSAISSRTREIGTMRALGFSKFSILLSFLGESVLLCTLGGILGLLAALPLKVMTFSTFNNFTEATFAFRFGPLVFLVAFLMTFAMGVFGGLFPAVRAVRLDVVRALREL